MSEKQNMNDKTAGQKAENGADNNLNTQSTEVTVLNDEKPLQSQGKFTIQSIEHALMADLKQATQSLQKLQANVQKHLKTADNPHGALGSSYDSFLQLKLDDIVKTLQADLKAAKDAASNPAPAAPNTQEKAQTSSLVQLDTFGDKSLKLN